METALKDLIGKREWLQSEIKKNQAALEETETQIAGMVSDQESSIRAKTGKDTGVVNIIHDGIEVKVDRSKSVAWDQGELIRIADTIKAAKDDPAAWMDLKWSISESKFKAWPESVRKVFEKARTVKPGKPKFTFKIPEVAK